MMSHSIECPVLHRASVQIGPPPMTKAERLHLPNESRFDFLRRPRSYGSHTTHPLVGTKAWHASRKAMTRDTDRRLIA